MAKKYQAKEVPKKAATVNLAANNNKFQFKAATIIPLAIALLYLCIHFIPNLDAYDAMGPQWLYLVILDFLVIVFILANKDKYDLAAASVIKNTFSKLYLAFFALAGLSIFTAINATEGWVCYARLIATIIAYFNLAILFNGRLHLFKWLAQILGLLLLFESFQSITQFVNNADSLALTDLIMGIKGTTGNKNIFAAGLVVKIPFVIYCIRTSGLARRILNIIILALGSLTIFIVNARASYLSLLMIMVFYLVYCLLDYFKEKKLEQTLYRLSYVLLPLIAAYFISTIELTGAKNLQDDKTPQDFGTVTDRLTSLSNIADESNQVRLRLWAHAVDYTKHHPFIGCGIGNWKIASIPYQRTITNDLYVPIHAHNDFVETFAELGIPGGLLFLGMFVCILVFTIKTYQSNADEETKFIAVFTLLAFIGYAIDALFNFPSERPISQLFFAMIVGLNVNAFIQSREEKEEASKKQAAFKSVYGLSAILFLIPACYVTYLTYQSLIIQRIIIPDMNNEPLKLKWAEIFPRIPSIPNLSASAQPMDAIKGRYLYEAGKYDEALVLLNKGAKANPVIGYSEFLKAGLYFKEGKLDSAAANATIAFYTRPKAKTYFQTYIAVLAGQKDTANIERAFKEYDRYRKHPFGWDMYLRGMMHSLEKGTPHLLLMADSAIRLYPGDSTLLQRRREVVQIMGATAASQNGKAVDLAKAQQYYSAGVASFGRAQAAAAANNEAVKKEEYIKAAGDFLKAAEINPGNYIIYENAAMCYFNMGEYRKSLIYFNKVLDMKTSVDGKTEYFAAVAHINLGKRDEGCSLLGISKSKGWKDADVILKSHCGK